MNIYAMCSGASLRTAGLMLVFLHFGGLQWGPTAFSKHYAVIPGRWNSACVCFHMLWLDLMGSVEGRLPNGRLGVTARLAA